MYLFLHLGAVKSSVRETVERKYIGVGLFQPVPKFLETIRPLQYHRGFMRKPKTNSKSALVGQTLLHFRNVYFQISKGGVPTFPCMDVAAIA
jgi:hypothetical protein